MGAHRAATAFAQSEPSIHPRRAERRKHGRVRPEETVVFLIVWSMDDPDHRSQPIYGSGVDLSADGVQIGLDFPIPVGHVVHLSVEFPGRGETFALACRIVWTGQVVDESTHRMGAEILDAPGTDKERWNELFD